MTRNLHRAGCTAFGTAAMLLTLGCGMRPSGPGGASVATGALPAWTGSVHGGPQAIYRSDATALRSGEQGHWFRRNGAHRQCGEDGRERQLQYHRSVELQGQCDLWKRSAVVYCGDGWEPRDLAGIHQWGDCVDVRAGAVQQLERQHDVEHRRGNDGGFGIRAGPVHGGPDACWRADTVALGRAFATVRTLADPSTGASPGPDAPSWATVPVAAINTLADAMASCINSNGGTALAKTPKPHVKLLLVYSGNFIFNFKILLNKNEQL